ncbi:uncharacterized protein B0I36DRAFT_226198, partial [Microdochium trichocladiopsis]
PKLSNTTLVVDALDECDKAEKYRTRLLKLILHLAAESRAKWLLSCRNEVILEGNIPPEQSSAILSLESKDNAAHVRLGVDEYIQRRISKISEDDPELQKRIGKQLREKANGTFFLVSLVAQELERAPQWELEQILADMLPGLNELY